MFQFTTTSVINSVLWYVPDFWQNSMVSKEPLSWISLDSFSAAMTGIHRQYVVQWETRQRHAGARLLSAPWSWFYTENVARQSNKQERPTPPPRGCVRLHQTESTRSHSESAWSTKFSQIVLSSSPFTQHVSLLLVARRRCIFYRSGLLKEKYLVSWEWLIDWHLQMEDESRRNLHTWCIHLSRIQGNGRFSREIDVFLRSFNVKLCVRRLLTQWETLFLSPLWSGSIGANVTNALWYRSQIK